jgi:hypothetical protein
MRAPPWPWAQHVALRLCAGLFACIIAHAAAAQPVTVLSGEHDGFTRLVVDIGATRDWRLEGGARQYRLVLDPPIADFALARVFDRIGRARLADLTVADGLALSLGCNCAIAASRYQQRYLVLDIRAAPPAPMPESALPDTTRLLTQAAPFAAATLPVPRPSPPVDLEQAASVMAAQLARAAAQGLLQASEVRPMTDADPLPAVEIATPPSAAPEQRAEPFFPTLPIRAETAFDRVMPATIALPQHGERRGCTAAALNMQDWPAGEGLYDGLGALRTAVFDERDQLQHAAVLALARHYLAFGFGAEAGFWLDQIDSAPPLLRALAALVDDLPGPHFPPEPDPLACGDEELLLRYLDHAFDPTLLTGEEAGRLQRAVASLPVTLRDQIAPRIARALHADGFDNAARNLRDMLWRGGRISAGALLRLDRDLALGDRDPQAMRAALATALRDAGGEGVAALAHAMAFDREAGGPPDAQHIAVAEAMLRENAIGPTSIALWHEVVLAHGATGDLDRMLALLAAPQVRDQDRDATLTAVFAARLAARDTPALLLLARIFGPSWRAEGSAAGRARVAAIAHLSDLGLTGAAEALRAGQRVLILPGDATTAPPPGDTMRLAWQEGNWPRIAVDATGPHRAMAARFLDAARATAPRDAGLLASDLSLLSAHLDDSRALRETVNALLAAPEPIAAGVVE